MSETLRYSGTLTVVSCWCGIRHAVPEELNDMQERAHRDGHNQQHIFCPVGHRHIIAGEGEAAKLRREVEAGKKRLEWAKQSEHYERAQREKTERQLSAQRGVTTRLKNRVAQGVCPCCKRTFQNLARHMSGQHPDFTDGDQP